MPFTYNPSSYVGGQLLAAGLQNFGQSIGSAIADYTKLQQQTAQSDAMMQYLSQTPGADGKPILDPKAYERYMTHSAAQRAYVAGGMTAGMKFADAIRQSGIEDRLKLAQGNYYTMRGAADVAEGGRFELSPEEAAAYAKAGRVPLRTSAKQFQVAEMPDVIDTDSGGTPIYSQDKAMYKSGGKWKPTTEAMRKSIEDYEAAQAAQKAAAAAGQGKQSTGGSMWNPLNWFGTPSQGQPTPPAKPVPKIEASTPATAPTPGALGGNIAEANQIKARYQAGELTREEAKAQLAALGIK